MPPVAREFFTVDLRGQRATLAARAARDGVTESDVLRSALAVALGNLGSDGPTPSPDFGAGPLSPPHVKLSVRPSRPATQRLDQNARAAGLSRSAYLTRLIDGASRVIASADRAAGFSALSASAIELAVLGRDINHLTQLLRQGAVAAAREYRERLETVGADLPCRKKAFILHSIL
jgi:hypothetical protein